MHSVSGHRDIRSRIAHAWSAWLLCSAVAAGQSPPAAPGGASSPAVQLFSSLQQDAPAGNAAILVGINRFKDAGSLSFAVHDAIELGHLFVFELKLIPPTECYLLLAGEPTAEPVKQHLEQLQRAGAKVKGGTRTEIVDTFLDVCGRDRERSNLLICSFSTHGFEQDRDPYIMPSDGRRDDLRATAISLKYIEEKLEGTERQRDLNKTAGHRLLLVDACQERVSSERSLSTDGQPSSLAFMDALKSPTGQAKLAACSPGEMSIEGASLGGVGHGLFTWHFLEALRGGARVDEQNIVRLEAVSDYVSRAVKASAEDRNRGVQRPFLVGPVLTKSLPLAARGDDMASLRASLARQPLGDFWTADLRDALQQKLGQIDPADAGDRRLVAATRNFVNGSLGSEFFAPYLERDKSRWNISPGGPQAGDLKIVRLPGGVTLELVLIPAGEFQMGSTDRELEEAARFDPSFKKEFGSNEKPHQVRISKSFYLGVHEVTKAQFAAFVQATNYKTQAELDGHGGLGTDSKGSFVQRPEYTWKNPGFPQTDAHPVVHVSWNDAVAFCEWLSRTERKTYRLPTEAEWEYACRGGTSTLFQSGNNPEGLAGCGNVADASTKAKFPKWDSIREDDGSVFTAAVGRYTTNAFGLHDMHGNVWEWCSDWYGEDYYASSPSIDPEGPISGTDRVFRGASWNTYASRCRSATRGWGGAPARGDDLGFRVALSPLGQ